MNKYQNIPILEVAILEMARMKKGQSFSPDEVLQWIFPESWQHFIPEILSEIESLHKTKRIIVLQNGSYPDYPLKSEVGILISTKI